MEKTDNITLEEKCQSIIKNVPLDLNDDQKMRYVYHELGLIFAKDVDFFYDKENEDRRKQIFNNYQTIENNQVICRNATYKYVEVARSLGLNCKMIEIKEDNNNWITHWAIEYIGENNKRYIINPIPDFYRIQMGFSTKSFCSTSEYTNYDGEAFDTMPEDYLREIDEKLGYLSGGMYTEEFLKKLREDINARIGPHVIKTTNIYQNYYYKLLELMKKDSISLDERLEEIKKIDPNFEKNKEIIKNCIYSKKISKDMRKILQNLSIKELVGSDSNLELKRNGANYIGVFDITKKEVIKTELLLYKFNYMMECFPQLTSSLTGFIEKKNFFDELKKYIFQKGERDMVHRHTIFRTEDGKKEYYMMFSLKINSSTKNKVYCFFNPYTKKCIRNIEPLEFMLEHNLTPRKDSSLNEELEIDKELSDMLEVAHNNQQVSLNVKKQ